MVQITNGRISYGQTVKTGEWENKKGEVELSFSVAEGTDADAAIKQVQTQCRAHLHTMLGLAFSEQHAHLEGPGNPAGSAAGTKPAAAPKAPKAPKAAAKNAADASIIDDLTATGAAAGQAGEGTAAHADDAGQASAAGEENLDDLLGGTITDAPKEITDKELNDATQACQARAKNGAAVRKALNDLGVKTPPGRIIDLPQDKRQAYLDKLKAIQPLA